MNGNSAGVMQAAEWLEKPVGALHLKPHKETRPTYFILYHNNALGTSHTKEGYRNDLLLSAMTALLPGV